MADARFIMSKWSIPVAALVWAVAASIVHTHLGPVRLGELLYLPPVLVLAWWWGRGAGIALSAAISAAASGASAAADLSAAVVLFGFLATVAVLADGWRVARQRERVSSRHDALTGIANRTAFREAAAAELNRSARTGRPFTVAYLDCDDFKAFNDACGHPAGDALLQSIARCLKSNTRNYDTVARMGGDEFAVLLPDTTAPIGQMVVERLHERLRECARELVANPAVLQFAQEKNWTAGPVTFSIGAVTFQAAAHGVDDLIRAADQAMYAAKRAGKNGSVTQAGAQAMRT